MQMPRRPPCARGGGNGEMQCAHAGFDGLTAVRRRHRAQALVLALARDQRIGHDQLRDERVAVLGDDAHVRVEASWRVPDLGVRHAQEKKDCSADC
eukprot:scaffold24708_cov101-Isochrysis_galbana.AAC.4